MLAARACLRAVAGLVRVYQHPEHPSVSLNQPELISLTAADYEGWALVRVIGPDLGQDEWGRGQIARYLTDQQPLALDADGLNWLAQSLRHQDNLVLTPHPGEAARLLGCTIADIETDRFAVVQALQRRYDGVVL